METLKVYVLIYPLFSVFRLIIGYIVIITFLVRMTTGNYCDFEQNPIVEAEFEICTNNNTLLWR